MTVPPPSVLAFSRTIGRSPSSWAASAPARPAMPDPRTTTSQASPEVIGSTSLHSSSPVILHPPEGQVPRPRLAPGAYLARKFDHDRRGGRALLPFITGWAKTAAPRPADARERPIGSGPGGLGLSVEKARQGASGGVHGRIRQQALAKARSATSAVDPDGEATISSHGSAPFRRYPKLAVRGIRGDVRFS